MSNTLTNLLPAAYEALDVVSRELSGMIPAVRLVPSLERVSTGQTIYVPAAPANAAGFDITPAMAVPAAADQTIGNTSLTISKSRGMPFSWSGEEQKGINAGVGYNRIRVDQIAQAIRALVNEVEADLCGLYNTTSRAYGTAATTPFGTAGDFTDASNVLKILKDNGSPLSDNQLVVNTTAGANFLGKQSNSSVQFADNVLRQGVFATTAGMDIRESHYISSATAGTMASATSTSAAFTVGQTLIPLATAGTGLVSAGDVITFANDTNKYVITSVSFAGANPASGDTITLAQPGLRVAQGVATRAITVVATSARNMAFNRSAIILAARLPARPAEGDMAMDVEVITDPRTGMSFEIAVYPGQRMVRYEVSAAWGFKNIKPAHTALLLG
jgi:hypothetical protein